MTTIEEHAASGDGPSVREQIETLLNRVRPLLLLDGVGIELVAVQGNCASVHLTGLSVR